MRDLADIFAGPSPADPPDEDDEDWSQVDELVAAIAALTERQAMPDPRHEPETLLANVLHEIRSANTQIDQRRPSSTLSLMKPERLSPRAAGPRFARWPFHTRRSVQRDVK